jgi:hypothetical protein
MTWAFDPRIGRIASPQDGDRRRHSAVDLDDLQALLKAGAHAEAAILALRPLLDTDIAPDVEAAVLGIGQALSALRDLASRTETIGIS